MSTLPIQIKAPENKVGGGVGVWFLGEQCEIEKKLPGIVWKTIFQTACFKNSLFQSIIEQIQLSIRIDEK